MTDDDASSRPRRGYGAALLGGLAGLAAAGLAAWLHDVLVPLEETTMAVFGAQLFLVMVAPFLGASLGAGCGLWLRGHAGAWSTAAVTALLGVPVFPVVWFVLLDVPWMPFAAIPALIGVLPLAARSLVLAARD